MESIKHELWIDAQPERVYELLSSAEGISKWWDKQTERQTPAGTVFEHSPGQEHGTVKFLVLEAVENSLVRWRCISEHPQNTPAFDWTNTEMSFRLGRKETSEVATEEWAKAIPVKTVLRFEHSGWKDGAKHLPFCSYAWAEVLSNLSKTAAESGG